MAIVSFTLGLLSATSLTAAAGVVEGNGAPPSMVGSGCETPTKVLPKVLTPWSPDYGPGGFIEGTG
jgi:hypothetical protein